MVGGGGGVLYPWPDGVQEGYFYDKAGKYCRHA